MEAATDHITAEEYFQVSREGDQTQLIVDTRAESVLAFRRSHPEAPLFDIAFELPAGDMLETPMLPGFALAVEHLFRRS